MAMLRRDFMKALVMAAAAPGALLGQQQAGSQAPLAGAPAPAPVPWMMGIKNADRLEVAQPNPEMVAESELRFFTPVQMATLRRLSEVLMPRANGYPSGVDAETPAFLDFYMVESSGEMQTLYRGGLDWMDGQAMKQFRKPFAALTETQVDTLVRPWLRTWMTDHPPVEAPADFVNKAHADIREATVNSPAWNAAAEYAGRKAVAESLYWSPVEPDIYRDFVASARQAAHAGTMAN